MADISKEMNEALNEQINMELSAAYLYLSLHGHFDAQSLNGFAAWMRKQSKEEVEHAMRIHDFVLDRNGSVTLQTLEAPKSDLGDLRSSVQAILHHEQKVTASIHSLYEKAGSLKDYATQEMLHWFLDEQVEEEQQVNDVLGRLELIENTGGNIIQLDRELAKKHSENNS